MLLPPTTPERQAIIDNAGRISKESFIIVLWTFTAIATCAASIRLGLRLIMRRRWSFDDYLILLATVFSVASSVVVFIFLDTLYLVQAINYEPGIRPMPQELPALVKGSDWRIIVLNTSWTAISLVKFSFLAFFKELVKDVSRNISRYYWFVVVATFVMFAFTICHPYMLCPYFGAEARKCFPDTSLGASLSINSIATALDILTDLCILSLPILVLRKAMMHWRQKYIIAVFLCLSAFMVVIALIRLAGARYPSKRSANDFDTAWQAFWQAVETNLAVFMGSIMMMRSIYNAVYTERHTNNSNASRQSNSFARWMRFSVVSQQRGKSNATTDSSLQRPTLPRHSTNSSKSLMHLNHSGSDTLPRKGSNPETASFEEGDYHSYVRHEHFSLQSLPRQASVSKASENGVTFMEPPDLEKALPNARRSVKPP